MPEDRIVATSGLVVRAAAIANRLFLLAVCVGLLWSWLAPTWFETALIAPRPGADPGWTLDGLRLLLLIGIVMAIATDRLLMSLRRMIASARAGDPFIAINARRLQTIGWSLLTLQLLDLAGAMLRRFFPGLGAAAPDGEISVGGWVAVLMVFVLSRVFAAGAAMREELAATV